MRRALMRFYAWLLRKKIDSTTYGLIVDGIESKRIFDRYGSRLYFFLERIRQNGRLKRVESRELRRIFNG